MSELFKNFPSELKDTKAWVLWRKEHPDGRAKPTKVPFSVHTGMKASNQDPNDWATFDEASAKLADNLDKYEGLGFVLSENDNFGFIDLDDPSDITDPTKRAEAVAMINQAYNNAPDTYTELSPSGKGLHMIVKCDPNVIPTGKRRKGVEMYTKGRYMTMTGNVQAGRTTTITQADAYMQGLFGALGGDMAPAAPNNTGLRNAVDVEHHTDEEVVRLCMGFANGDKFDDLYTGRFEDHAPSRSEADIALVNLIQIGTKNPEQIKRIFRASELGQRPKANRDDYVDAMVRKSFDRELPEINVAALRAQFDEVVARQEQEQVSETSIAEPTIRMTTEAPEPVLMPEFNVGRSQRNLSFPPGLVGSIATFIYNSSNRPVPEIAIAGALGLMAGICGRSFSINGSGLNLYIVLLAATGTGKEAINSGISRLMTTVAEVSGDPDVLKFVGPSAIASGQALHRQLIDESSSFTSIFGEVGIMLNSMSGQNTSESKAGLRKVILDLYSKSDPGQMLSGMAYAKKEDSKNGVKSPAFSLVGESTPERFYEALTPELVSEGLMPRFITIEYEGDRVPRNRDHHRVMPDTGLVASLCELTQNSMFWNKHDENVVVAMAEAAEDLMDAFDTECDGFINDGIRKMREGSASMEVMQNLWNRAHLKALRIAGVIACGMPSVDGRPHVTKEVAEWAISLVRTDAQAMQNRFEKGDVGVSSSGPDENKQLEEAERAVRFFLEAGSKDPSKLKSYGATAKMVTDYVIPHAFFSKKLSALATFKNDRIGGTAAAKRAIETLILRGDLKMCDKLAMMEKFETTALGYQITNVYNFLEQKG
jgi:hypothetical protein